MGLNWLYCEDDVVDDVRYEVSRRTSEYTEVLILPRYECWM